MLPEFGPWLWTLLFLLFGACVGSFLNVCIHRLPAGMSIVWPPSHCPRCLKRIAWYDNLPVVAYFVLRGKCRHCRQPFSARYALIEALTGLVFAAYFVAYFVLQVRGPAYARWDVYLVHMALASALIVSSAIDWETKEIYTVVTNGGMLLAVVLSAAFPAIQSQTHVPDWTGQANLDGAIASLVGLAVGGGVIWLIRIIGGLVFRREAMGFGDVLLMGLIGAVLGWEATLLVFFIAPFFGLAYGLGQMIRHKEHEVPYGPFLSMATGVVMLLQRELVDWFGPGIAAVWQSVFGS